LRVDHAKAQGVRPPPGGWNRAVGRHNPAGTVTPSPIASATDLRKSPDVAVRVDGQWKPYHALRSRYLVADRTVFGH